jgi:hypothetical protein
MNRIKRLSSKDCYNEAEMQGKVRECMCVLSGFSLASMDTMNGKQIGLALNAICGQGKDFLPLMRVCGCTIHPHENPWMAL